MTATASESTSTAQAPQGAGAEQGGDNYARLMRAPIVGGLAKRAGLPRPPAVQRHRRCPGDRRHGARRRRTRLAPGGGAHGLARGDRGGDCGTRGGPRRRGRAGSRAPRHRACPGRPRWRHRALQGPRLRRDRDRRLHAARRASALLPSASCARSSAAAACSCSGHRPRRRKGTREHTAQRALEGFVRALGKEVGRRAATAQLVYVGTGAEDALESTLRFLLSPRSAYVSGQVVVLSAPSAAGAEALLAKIDWEAPLAGQHGARDGCRARHRRRHRRGPRARRRACGRARCRRRAGRPAHAHGAPRRRGDRARHHGRRGTRQIAEHFEATALDMLVHNAGVTRDRTLAKMPEERWSSLLEINLSSEERINGELLDAARAAPERAHRVRVLDRGHRGQRGPDELLDGEGRRDRDGAGARPVPRRGARRDDQRGRARASSRPR